MAGERVSNFTMFGVLFLASVNSTSCDYNDVVLGDFLSVGAMTCIQLSSCAKEFVTGLISRTRLSLWLSGLNHC